MKKREIIIEKIFSSWITKDVSTFLEPFHEEIVYIESWGPAYKNKKQIEKWFIDWNIENTVLQWDILAFFHIENVCICEWYFKCESNGKISGFNGVSLITFNEADEITLLKEFQSRTPNFYPYELL